MMATYRCNQLYKVGLFGTYTVYLIVPFYIIHIFNHFYKMYIDVTKWLKKWWLPLQEKKRTTNARVAASYGKSISCIFILCGTRLTRQCRNVQATGSTLGPLKQTLQWLLSLWTTRLSVAEIGPTSPLGIDGLGSTTFKMLQKMINLLFYGAGRWVIHFNCT